MALRAALSAGIQSDVDCLIRNTALRGGETAQCVNLGIWLSTLLVKPLYEAQLPAQAAFARKAGDLDLTPYCDAAPLPAVVEKILDTCREELFPLWDEVQDGMATKAKARGPLAKKHFRHEVKPGLAGIKEDIQSGAILQLANMDLWTSRVFVQARAGHKKTIVLDVLCHNICVELDLIAVSSGASLHCFATGALHSFLSPTRARHEHWVMPRSVDRVIITSQLALCGSLASAAASPKKRNRDDDGHDDEGTAEEKDEDEETVEDSGDDDSEEEAFA